MNLHGGTREQLVYMSMHISCGTRVQHGLIYWLCSSALTRRAAALSVAASIHWYDGIVMSSVLSTLNFASSCWELDKWNFTLSRCHVKHDQTFEVGVLCPNSTHKMLHTQPLFAALRQQTFCKVIKHHWSCWCAQCLHFDICSCSRQKHGLLVVVYYS
jgi:hypothetical protein